MKRWRKTVAAVALSVLALAAVRLWHIHGLVRRITIDGPSMAPSLCGIHFEVTCGDCDFPFRIDPESPPKSGLAACPNCGFGENKLLDAKMRPADRVVVDSWPFLWQTPMCGEIVAAHQPDLPATFFVKRVAGVTTGAAQTLSIDHGDLFVNGQLQQKSLAELRRVRVLVHDNNFRPQRSQALRPRWRATEENSSWQPAGGGFRFSSAASTPAEVHWLKYQNWNCTADARLRGIVAPVRDNDSYNQGPGPRELNAVPDVMLSCRVRATGAGDLRFTAQDGDESFEIVFASPEATGAQREEENTLRLDLSLLQAAGSDVEFGLCDQQLQLSVDGRTIIRRNYERSAGPNAETLQPLAIGARGLAVEISRLKVWRDIYHLDPQGLPRLWNSDPISADQVILLGDNPPVSIDSRHWQPSGIPRKSILGCVWQPSWMRRD